LGREFYGDFGTFDVELDFASNYVVGATGFLTNRSEVLPNELRQKLDISNFKDKPWGSKPSEITPYKEGERKVWKYHAENVHDFAFTADPTYRIGEAKWKDKTCYALAQESHASKWQNAAEYTAKIIQTFSEDIGMYTYHKMIVADARDGMEYPMLTLDGGKDPSYRGLLVHEVAHNWFFGQIGTNESYRAAMDEGFTQFLTAWGLTKIDGDTLVTTPPASKYKRKYREPVLVKERSVYRGYMRDAMVEEDPSLNTHSDDFQGAIRHGGGYGHVYYKTATMLYNLQYVLGDELFLEAMQHYFDQWKIAHPYFEDFRSSIINYTRVDLNWFFDQWFESSKNIDYAIKNVKKGEEDDEYILNLKRKGEMQMPLDIEIETKNGEVKKYHIPNTWNVKEDAAKSTVLHRWIGWGNRHNTEYHAHIKVPDGVKNVRIDPTNRLADVNMLNNTLKCPASLKFDHRIYNLPDRTKYELFWRPDVWYNGYDGLKIGAHLNGNYLNKKHKFDLTVWYNSGIGQQNIATSLESDYDLFSYRLNYSTPTTKLLKRSHIHASGKFLDGLHGYTLGFKVFSRDRDKKTMLFTYFKSLYRNDNAALTYLLFPSEWIASRFNNTVNIGINHRYKYFNGNGALTLTLRSTTLGSDYDYSSISMTTKNRTKLKKFVLNTRIFAQYGFGDNWAPESQLFLAGANPERLMDNKFTRSVGIVPDSWLGYGAEINHFHQGGGLNLRGYSGYLAPYEVDSNDTRFTYKGTSGLAFNGELEFDKYINFRPRFLRNWLGVKTYLFTDAGVINYDVLGEDFSFANLRWDAGVGATFSIKKWGPLEKVNPLVIRVDLPLFLNRIPALE
ncbi:MAG: hypothetical protein MRY83_10825, partial [Flavobacteriales bacterium]|nr:hypothetical protein [Flavobacteriales bacterium]